jgi:hypothetical protein
MKTNEIEFMLYMEQHILPHRRTVDYDVLITAGNFVGIHINTSCRSCASKSGIVLINKYGQLKKSYEDWKEMKSKDVIYETTVTAEIDNFKELKETDTVIKPKKNVVDNG